MTLTIDDTTLQRIEELSKKYKVTYNKEVDYTVVPRGITQEKLIKCLELMISDNLSLLAAYNKLEESNNDKYSSDTHGAICKSLS